MEKYLRHYAEPEIAALDGLTYPEQWANVLVIPACNETPAFLRPPPPCGGRSLLILVINEPVSASDEVSASNQALAAMVRAQFDPQWQSATRTSPGFELSLLRDRHAQRDVLLVDRFSEGHKLPAKGGVGHARKIGADLAASLIHRGSVLTSWIHCSDADVRLPKTYFSYSNNTVPNAGSKYAALVYPFRHCAHRDGTVDKDVISATQLYELSLRYYVAGLKYARSPYAFHTIGSTIAVEAIHYAMVRGFPKREAGEDFYLLNKLAKVGSVLEPDAGPGCEPIEIEARCSDRVPFGTGAAVGKITGLAEPLTEYVFYHPAVFELLRYWLHSLPEIWQARPDDLEIKNFPGPPDVDEHGDHKRRGEQESLLEGLKNIRTDRALGHAFRQSKDLEQFTRQMHIWFDAFRTLKLIHSLRDSHFPSVNYAGLGANQTFCNLLEIDPELLFLHEKLGEKISRSG